MPESHQQPELTRGLGPWDATLLVIGSVLGTGIFFTTGDMAKVLPHQGMILLVWVGGGLLTLFGAFTYAELGAMFPRAGGIYHFLKEAYGPLPAFLYGWSCFWVIMTGGIAAIAVGFAEYLGSFVPFSSGANVLVSLSLLGFRWTLSGVQVTAVAAILGLSAINWVGLRQGATVGNILTVIKVGAVVAFVVAAFSVPPKAATALTAPLPPGSVVMAFGAAMVAALWTYDGWYGLTLSAGEVRNPGRDLPLGLVLGTAVCIVLYAALNLAYFRGLGMAEIAATRRIGESAAAALLGGVGAWWLSAAVVVSSFGCLAATILYSSRLYLPMAQDRLFFAGLGVVNPRFHTPGRSLWAQGAWSSLLALSGTYDQLYTYTVFIAVLFHVATGAAVFVLRRTRPQAPRPYRVWGYPVVPALFLLGSFLLVGSTLAERPVEAVAGLLLLLLGLPAYAFWRRSASGASHKI